MANFYFAREQARERRKEQDARGRASLLVRSLKKATPAAVTDFFRSFAAAQAFFVAHARRPA